MVQRSCEEAHVHLARKSWAWILHEGQEEGRMEAGAFRVGVSGNEPLRGSTGLTLPRLT